MRISSVQLAGKVVGRFYDFCGLALKGAITAGFVLVAVSAVYEGTLVPEGEISPIEAFLLENPDEPVTGLGEFLKNAPGAEKVVPQKPQKKMKKINLRVAKVCHQYDTLLRKYFPEPELRLRKAQMFQESSCNTRAVGTVGEQGLFQVKVSTCNDMGVKGDLFNPETNIRCAAKYLRWLCKEHDYCEPVPQLVAYNAGARGARYVRNLYLHAYPRAILKKLGLA
jgi:hypothetical protein